jgi:hypothetical protein
VQYFGNVEAKLFQTILTKDMPAPMAHHGMEHMSMPGMDMPAPAETPSK